MDIKTHRIFSYAMYAALMIGTVILCFNSHQSKLPALVLYAVFAAMLIYFNLRFYKQGFYEPLGKYFLAIELMLAIVIQYFDSTHYEGFYFFILIATALMKYEAKFSFPYAALAILLNLTMLLYKCGFEFDTFWRINSPYLIPRAFIISAILLARYAVRISHRNNILARQLQDKSEDLEQALAQLRAQMEIVEETADLRAREQLMRELHDKLGHMLATAHISAQAAGVLLKKDTDQAKLRLDTAVTQIQSALQSLRDVIAGRTIGDFGDADGLVEKLCCLLSETQKCTQIPIRYSLPEDDSFDRLDNKLCVFIYNALMEGLTNGIRHGQVTQFDFHLEQKNGLIAFCLKDNGIGFDGFTAGYGLTKMQRDAARLGADLSINGEHGCTLRILIPLSERERA